MVKQNSKNKKTFPRLSKKKNFSLLFSKLIFKCRNKKVFFISVYDENWACVLAEMMFDLKKKQDAETRKCSPWLTKMIREKVSYGCIHLLQIITKRKKNKLRHGQVNNNKDNPLMKQWFCLNGNFWLKLNEILLNDDDDDDKIIVTKKIRLSSSMVVLPEIILDMAMTCCLFQKIVNKSLIPIGFI